MERLRHLSESRGYFLRREALNNGYVDRQLYAALGRKELVRVRHGAYCHADVWRRLSEVDRHLARAFASQDLAEGPTALSHVTALAHFGCPLWNVPLDLTHLTRRDEGGSRREAGVVHHVGTLGMDDVVEREGRVVTSGTRSTLDGLSMMDVESGMVSGDWMLRQGHTDFEQCWTGKTAMNHWPDTRVLEVTLRLLDGRSQSVGESRCRYCLWRMHVPMPELQWHVYDRHGVLVAITDFAWPDQNVYGEFDGKVKYGRELNPERDDLTEVLFSEKRREDAIRRATDGTIVRWTWADLHPTSAPSRQLLELLRRVA